MMNRIIHNLFRVTAILTINSSCNQIEATSLLPTSNQQYAVPSFINLSYQSYDDANKVSPLLQTQLGNIFKQQQQKEEEEELPRDDDDEQAMTEERSFKRIEIDISSSHLGDKGIENVLDSIQKAYSNTFQDLAEDSSDDNNNEGGDKVVQPATVSQFSLNLQSRFNQLTPQGASAVFRRITAFGEFGKQPTILDENKENATKEIVFENATAVDDNVVIDEEKDEGTEEENNNNNNNKNSTTIAVDESNENNQVEKVEKSESSNPIYIESLDVGYNNIGLHEQEFDSEEKSTLALQKLKSLRKSLKKMIKNEGGMSCPRVLRMDRCGLGAPICRSIGKGIIYNSIRLDEKSKNNNLPTYLSNCHLNELFLSGNPGISDGGAAALAAALKKSPISISPVLETLDLSSCGIGDAGAEALAIAIENNPGCVKNLNLSNNQISDKGAIAIGKALQTGMENMKKEKGTSCIDRLDLSGNPGIGDDGTSELALAIEYGAVKNLSIRSCSVRADGGAAIGEALGRLACRKDKAVNSIIEVDLSGNKLGLHELKKKGSAISSASALTSQATAVTASYMNFIGKKIKSGLKDAGLDAVVGGGAESDDEEEEIMKMAGEFLPEEDEANGRYCGVRALCDAMIDELEEGRVSKYRGKTSRKVKLGLRMCHLDDPSAEAIAALIIHAKDENGIDLSVDCENNIGVGEDYLYGLKKGDPDDLMMKEMAERNYDESERLEFYN